MSHFTSTWTPMTATGILVTGLWAVIMVLHYSRHKLLNLQPSSKTPIALDKYHSLTSNHICATRPTHRGIRSGQQRPIPTLYGSRTRSKQNHAPQKQVCFKNLITIPRSRSIKSNRILNVSMLNVRSVNNKATTLCEHVLENDIDLFFMTETWLRGSD